MPKKKKQRKKREIKYKCPNCRKMSLINDPIDCPFCGGGEVFSCESCDREFDINKKEL